MSDAKSKLEALVPASSKAEKAANGLATASANASKAIEVAGAAVLNTSKATNSGSISAKQFAVALLAAGNNLEKVSIAATGAAKATESATAASTAATAAAMKEAAAVDQVTAARGRSGRVPLITPQAAFVSPWGNPSQMKAANDNINNLAHASHSMSTQSMAAQHSLRSLVEQMVLGIPPAQILGGQIGHLSYVMSGPGGAIGAFGELGRALRGMLAPANLFVFAMIGAVLVLAKFVPWVTLTKSALNGLADILPTIAPYAAAAGAVLALAFAPAIATSIWNIAIAISSGLLGSIAALIATIGAIPIAIALIVADLIIFRDQWKAAIGVDVIGVAKQAVNYIIGSFVGAYHDVLFLWKQFPTVFGAAAIGAANLAIKAMNGIIGAAVAGLNVLIRSVNAILSIGGIGQKLGFGDPISQIDPAAGQFKEIANKAADSLGDAVKDRNAQLAKDLGTDYLGAIGKALGNAATGAAGMIKKFAAGLGVPKAKKAKSASSGGKTDEEKFDDIVKHSEGNLAKLQAERDAVGQTADEAARLKYETQLLNEAKQKNIDLTPTQRAQLIGLADDMAKVEVATQKAQEAFDFSKDLVKGFVSDLEQGLKSGEGFWKSFGSAALNVLTKIGDKMIDLAINSAFSASSGGGGIFGSLIKGIGSLLGGFGGGSTGSTTGGIGHFAKGGTFTNSVVSKPTLFANGGTFGQMGEAGPEAIVPLSKGPDGSLGVQMYGGSNSSGSNVAPIQVSYSPQYNVAQGADPKAIAELQKAQADAERNFKSNTLNAIGELRKRGAKV